MSALVAYDTPVMMAEMAPHTFEHHYREALGI